MDMRKILQSLDNVSTKPVEGTDGMAKFLRIVREADLNQPSLEVSETTLPRQVYLGGYGTLYLQQIVVSNRVKDGITPQQALAELKSRIGNLDPHNGEPPSPDFVKKYLSKRLEEGANPHKVTLPVQMAMQHYQQPATLKPRTRLIDKYFVEAETAILQRKQEEKLLLRQYAQVIAERVMMKEATFATTGGGAATGNPSITNKTTVLPKAAPVAAQPIDISVQGTGLDTNIVIEGIEVYSVKEFLYDLALTGVIVALGTVLATPSGGSSGMIAAAAIANPVRRIFTFVIKYVQHVAKTQTLTKEAISAWVKSRADIFLRLLKEGLAPSVLTFSVKYTALFNTVTGILEKYDMLPDWAKGPKPFDPNNPEASISIK